MPEILISELERVASIIEGARTQNLTLNDAAQLRRVCDRLRTLRQLVDSLSDGVSLADESLATWIDQPKSFDEIKRALRGNYPETTPREYTPAELKVLRP